MLSRHCICFESSSSLDLEHTFQHNTFLDNRSSIMLCNMKNNIHHHGFAVVAVEHIRLVVVVGSNLAEVDLVDSILVVVEVDLVDSMAFMCSIWLFKFGLSDSLYY